MNCVWDPQKIRANLARHGIAFEDASKIFEGPTLERVDDRLDYGEARVYAIGIVKTLRSLSSKGRVRDGKQDNFGMAGGKA